LRGSDLLEQAVELARQQRPQAKAKQKSRPPYVDVAAPCPNSCCILRRLSTGYARGVVPASSFRPPAISRPAAGRGARRPKACPPMEDAPRRVVPTSWRKSSRTVPLAINGHPTSSTPSNIHNAVNDRGLAIASRSIQIQGSGRPRPEARADQPSCV